MNTSAKPFFQKAWYICSLFYCDKCVIEQGRHSEAENELEKLLGASHAKDAIVELSKTDRGDEVDTIKLSELLCGRHSTGSIIALALMDKLGRKTSFCGASLAWLVD
ncbi:Major facilitator superfamily protein [Perilla frutescens var. hirtella]|nr:Major facilitator superfamily protein [Perilla frutescens var. hirtella]